MTLFICSHWSGNPEQILTTMLLWLLCSLLLIPRPSISLSLVWRAEELHISELSLSALPTPSPFPFSLSFQRSLYLDIDLPQPFRLTDYPHLSYCNLSFSITHTTCGPPAGLPGCVHLCAGTSEVPFGTCFILSKSPCTPTTVSHVLITPDIHFFIYLQTAIIILSVSG